MISRSPNELDKLVRDLSMTDDLGVLDQLDSRFDGNQKAFERGGGGLGHEASLVRLLDDDSSGLRGSHRFISKSTRAQATSATHRGRARRRLHQHAAIRRGDRCVPEDNRNPTSFEALENQVVNNSESRYRNR